MYRYRCFRNIYFATPDTENDKMDQIQQIQTSDFVIPAYCLLCKDAASLLLLNLLINCVVKEAECHTVCGNCCTATLQKNVGL